MTMKVTSVSKHEESLFHAPSAISVLTSDDILKAGAMNIPDALRLVPGMNVARSDSITWAISSRGFNDQYANKLLVLMDGRSVYNSIFSGVSWELQDVILEDLDRIEVIRGPGSTLWGANAVNGVINIASKSSKDTQGFLLRTGGGDELLTSSVLRYGGKLGDTLHYRVDGQYSLESLAPDGVRTDAQWQRMLGGSRIDWEPTDATTLTVQGDYGASKAEVFTPKWTPTPPYFSVRPEDADKRSFNVVARLTHRFSDTADIVWQNYVDGLDAPLGELDYRVRTFDTDLRHRFSLGERQEITWGGGFRHSTATLVNVAGTGFQSGDRQSLDVANGFVQDQIEIIPDRLHFTLGTKVEHNNLSGADLLPSGRLSWQITDKQTVWAAVSRTARTPSLGENDIVSTVAVMPQAASAMNPLGLPIVVQAQGSHDFESETVDVFELGYRVEVVEGLTLDLAVFRNNYDRLLTLEPGTPYPVGAPIPQYILQPLVSDNLASGHSTGGEIELDWKATDFWKVKTHASLNDVSIRTDAGSGDMSAVGAESRSPSFQFFLQNSFTLPHDVRADLVLRHVSSLFNGAVPSYVALDARLAWEFRPGCELALTGRNLLDAAHPEFGSSQFRVTPQTEVQRSVFASLTLRF